MSHYVDRSDTVPDEDNDYPAYNSPANRVRRVSPSEGRSDKSTNIFDHVQSLGATIEVLEDATQRLLMALEPILTPDETTSEKSGRTLDDRRPQSDLSHSLDNLNEQADQLRRRVVETHGRLEL